MRTVMKIYDLELIVEGPIYIGSGNEIAKKEYALLKKDHSVAIMDQNKLYQLLQKRKLTNKYLEFMLGNNRDDVGRWLERNQIKNTEYLTCVKYKLDYGNAEIDTHSKLNIMEFVKDAYGCPYIPGSSIKGMLRTVLLADELVKYNNQYQEIGRKVIGARTERVSRNGFLKREVDELESKYYRTLKRPNTKPNDAVNDIMSGFVISDSEPLKIDDLILCQKVEYHKDGREKKMNVLRESLRPETKVHFQLSIDTSICNFTKERIEKAIENFGNMYYHIFLQKFSTIKKPDKKAVWLGGGCGFVTKTEVYPLLGEKEGIRSIVNIFNALKVPANHKHNLDPKLGLSPHICKMTYYKNIRHQMGLGRLEITPKT